MKVDTAPCLYAIAYLFELAYLPINTSFLDTQGMTNKEFCHKMILTEVYEFLKTPPQCPSHGFESTNDTFGQILFDRPGIA